MGEAETWFMVLAIAAVASFVTGLGLGRGSVRRVWLWQGLCLGLLGLWVWMARNPAVATRALAPEHLRYLEGVGAAPAFMLLTGLLWARCTRRRQRAVAALALAACVCYFVYGGAWMLKPTPREGFGQLERGKLVMQSQDFSCVPAACATALRQLDVPATEAEMAELTETRPGSGSTLIRALAGLNAKLEATDLRPVVLQPAWDELRDLPMPAVTPLRLQPAQQHMVVLLRVTPRGAWVADPASGLVWMPRAQIEPSYIREVIVFLNQRRSPAPQLADAGW